MSHRIFNFSKKMLSLLLLVSLSALLAFCPTPTCKTCLNTRSTHSLVLTMRAEISGGSIVALVTPMKHSSNEIDYEKLVSLLQWHVQEGSDGAVILGTTGESSTISLEERTKIIQIAIKTVDGAFPIIVGTGTIDPNKVIESSKHAESLGADGVLVITPYYVKPPQRALVTHFKSVADAIKIPVILYNCQGRTGVNMAVETVAECAKHSNIIGLKDAVGNIIERLGPIRDSCRKNFFLYSGEDDLGCEYVRLGANGVISVTANVAPNKMHKMLEAAGVPSRRTEAEMINELLIPLHKGLFVESNPIPAKRALQLMGLIDAGIRPPLVSLDDSHLDMIIKALKTAGSL